MYDMFLGLFSPFRNALSKPKNSVNSKRTQFGRSISSDPLYLVRKPQLGFYFNYALGMPLEGEVAANRTADLIYMQTAKRKRRADQLRQSTLSDV